MARVNIDLFFLIAPIIYCGNKKFENSKHENHLFIEVAAKWIKNWVKITLFKEYPREVSMPRIVLFTLSEVKTD